MESLKRAIIDADALGLLRKRGHGLEGRRVIDGRSQLASAIRPAIPYRLRQVNQDRLNVEELLLNFNRDVVHLVALH